MRKLRLTELTAKAMCFINQELGRQRDRDCGKASLLCIVKSRPARAALQN